ncbi:BREX-1 system phosphatase PglZ type A [Filibacter tadaridae]|uniref:PglZ domain protein n=1 Tax=Filibacter tadaridae TaxID=2483811 RepID=A0A3P5WC99_9BACL|nr:BREX-1 system phosphatase PglZ type A [Filibacter tadaridae]VDC19307.1 PglZ domain protein [Filibacter tadaridae]
MKMSEIQLLLKASFEKELLNHQKRHVVFWYDAEGEFLEDIKELVLEGVCIWMLTENNLFATKYELETVDPGSHFLLYANMEKPAPREDWLLSILKMGSEFQTDRVTIMMRELGITDDTLRPVFKKYTRFFNNRTRYSAFTSYKTNRYTEEMIDLTVLAALVKSPFNTLDDIIRTLFKLHGDEMHIAWNIIEKYGDIETFWLLAERYYGYSLKEKSLSSLLNHFVLTYLSEQVSFIDFPDSWQQYVSNKPTNAIIYIDSWMNHRTDQSIFNERMDELSEVLNVNASIEEWEIEKVAEADTFRAFDENVIHYLQKQLISGANQFDSYEELIKKRRRLHWYPEYQHDYEAIEYARCLSKFAHEKNRHIPEQPANELFQLYENDYFQADLYYRKFYTAYDRVKNKERLSALQTIVEDLYTNWFLQELSVKWTSSLERQQHQGWPLKEIEQQSNFYRTYVQPYVSGGERLFVVVSDALRFEVAKELIDTLNHERKASTTLKAIQSVVPSYTDLGMAALLPHNKIRYEGQDVFVDGIRATGIANRKKILNRSVEETFALTYQDFIVRSRSELRQLLVGKKLIYIYHNEIDARGDHAATEMGVFEAVDDTMNDIRLIINQLVNAVSASTIMITADHGFIYQRDQLEKRDKIPKEVDDARISTRRFILSDQEVNVDSTLTYSMDYILESDQQLYATVPKGADRFQVQGAGANYVHGGAMLQEIVVPVITFKNDRSKHSGNDLRKVEVKLTNPVRKITGIITYLEFFQTEKVEGKRRPNRLLAYFVNEEGQRISNENIIIADSPSGDPRDRTYREKFVFRTMRYNRKARYYLILQEEEKTPHSIYDKIPFSIDITISENGSDKHSD